MAGSGGGMRSPWRALRRKKVRPRYGELTRADGTVIPLVFRPIPGEPGQFAALDASSERPVRVRSGDGVHVDVIGPGQGVRFEAEKDFDPNRWRLTHRAQRKHEVAQREGEDR
jgi:hypothetical protein